MNLGKKITIFLSQGLPKGIREVRIDQWSGKAICSPRNKLSEILKHQELDGCCVYFLLGEPGQGNFLDVYVGEADGFKERIKNHDYKQEWWQVVAVFFSQDSSLTKAGIQYLESITIERLKKTAKCNLKNSNNPSQPSIPKEDVSGLEIFYDNVSLIMPLLGYDIFTQKQSETVTGQELHLFCKGKGAVSEGILLDDGKIRVLKNSTAIKENAPAFEKHNYKKLKDELLKIGRLEGFNEYLIFTDDYIFDSASAAAAIILARSASGPLEWKNEKGETLKDILDNRLAK